MKKCIIKQPDMSILQDPYTGDELAFESDLIVNQITEKTYPYKNGYYAFIKDEDLQGNNHKYGHFYDRIAWSYDFSTKVYLFFKFGGEGTARREFLNELNIKDNNKVLEVSIGTGANLAYLNRNAEYYGIDISKGMLEAAVKNQRSKNITTYLFQVEAENLPFKDSSFDVVFHHGGINYFNNKEQAIREMIRVAKPGATVLISDETAELVRKLYQKNPISSKFYQDADEAIVPDFLIPKEMQDIKVKIINKGLIYCITFKKPLA